LFFLPNPICHAGAKVAPISLRLDLAHFIAWCVLCDWPVSVGNTALANYLKPT
jgi:hypothetical protein